MHAGADSLVVDLLDELISIDSGCGVDPNHEEVPRVMARRLVARREAEVASMPPSRSRYASTSLSTRVL